MAWITGKEALLMQDTWMHKPSIQESYHGLQQ